MLPCCDFFFCFSLYNMHHHHMSFTNLVCIFYCFNPIPVLFSNYNDVIHLLYQLIGLWLWPTTFHKIKLKRCTVWPQEQSLLRVMFLTCPWAIEMWIYAFLFMWCIVSHQGGLIFTMCFLDPPLAEIINEEQTLSVTI